MALHKKIFEMIEQTRRAELPPIKNQSLAQMRSAFAKLRALQGESRALPKVEGTFISPGPEIPLRLYYPQLRKKMGVILYFHPGSYVKGDIECSDTICREIAFQTGAIVASVGYRLSPEHSFPDPIDDGERAFHWIVSNASSLSIDSKRIILCGDSSGGNLAAALAHRLKAHPHTPIAQILIYPQLDYSMSLPSHKEFDSGFLLEEESLLWYRDQYVPKDVDYRHPELSPLFHSNLSGLPSTFIITAEYDPLRDEGEFYAKALIRQGIATTHRRYDGMTHGFFQMGGVLEESRQAMSDVTAYIKGILAS